MGSLDFAALRRAEVGSRLRVARERLGLSLAEIELATRVPLRHLEALERGDASTLPSPAYATGFVRAYARQIGLDANGLVRVYRGEPEGAAPLAAVAEIAAPAPPPVEPAWPGTTPEAPVAAALRTPLLIGAGALLLVLIVGAAVLLLRPAPPASASVELPPLRRASASQPVQERLALPPIGEQGVVLTASDRVWMRVYEQGGRTLFTGILAPGGSYHVPPDARDPRLSTGNTQALAISVGGAGVHGFTARSVTSARLSASALRGAPQPEARRSDRRQRRSRRDRPPEPLPALEVTTEAAAPSVTTPLGNAQ